MNIKQLFRQTLHACVVPVILGIVGLLLLMIAFALPTDRIWTNVAGSYGLFNKEGSYYNVVFDDSCSTLDNYTEAIYLNEALVDSGKAGILNSSLSGYCIVSNAADLPPIGNLAAILENDEDAVLYPENMRFFNGYMAVLKPMLMMTDYRGIRAFNLYAMLFLSLLLAVLMNRRGLGAYILPVAVSLLLIHPLVVALNMTYVGFFFCMTVASVCFLLLDEQTLRKRPNILFAVVGAVVFYFNMNYFQLLCFALPFMIYVLRCGLPDKPWTVVEMFSTAFISWCVGYAGMMAVKWILYAAAVDASIFKKMFSLIELRTGTNMGSKRDAVIKNIHTALTNKSWLYTELAFVLCSAVRWWRSGRKLRNTAALTVLLFLMAFVPFCRYLLFPNHVIVHHWVMYRILMMPVLAFNIAITGMG